MAYEIEPITGKEWDNLVDVSPQGTIFHKSGWTDICARHLNRKVIRVGCFKDDMLVGGYSLFIEDTLGVISIAKSTCSLTPYGGFLVAPCFPVSTHAKESEYNKILAPLLESTSECDDLIQVACPPQLTDIRPFTQSGWASNVRYAYYMDLNKDFTTGIDRDAQYRLRKADRNGITLETDSDIYQFYEMYADTFTRKNVAPAPKELVADLFGYAKENGCGEILSAFKDDKIVCADIAVWDKRMAYMWLAGSYHEHLNTGAAVKNTMGVFERMRDRHFNQMNIMQANVPEMARYACQFNPVLVPYYEIEKRSRLMKILKMVQ